MFNKQAGEALNFTGFSNYQRGGGHFMEQWITILQEVSFPIIISFYLLYRIETKLEAIHTALVSLNNPAKV